VAENINNTSFQEKHRYKPQINLAVSTAGRMWLVNMCAFLAVLQSSLTDSFSSLFIALSAVFVAVLTEFLVLHRKRRATVLKDGSAVASALILTLLLPNNISPFYAAAGAAFAMVVIKHSFGGLGSNWLNPAAGGWLFIRLSWPSAFNHALEGSPLQIPGAGTFPAGATPMDASLRDTLNRTIFSLTKAELSEGYMDLFSSGFPGIIADRAVFALLLGTIVISAFQVNRSWIPAIYLTVFGIFVRFGEAMIFGGDAWTGDVFFAFCSGGTLVAAFFLVSDPATGAKSNIFIAVTAAVGGLLAFLFRYYGHEPYGVVFAVVFINAILPLVRMLESRKLYEKQEIC